MTKITSLSILALLLILSFSATNAQAYVYATDVEWTGTDIDGSERSDIDNALGTPDGSFLSLDGGAAAFSFGTSFSTEASVVEITYGDRSNYVEYADVYVGTGTDADITSILSNITAALSSGLIEYWGYITNSSTSSLVDLSTLDGTFDFLILVDSTFARGGHDGDGFDVDAVGVSATPIPAAAWLLGSGLIGLVGFRRKFQTS